MKFALSVYFVGNFLAIFMCEDKLIFSDELAWPPCCHATRLDWRISRLDKLLGDGKMDTKWGFGGCFDSICSDCKRIKTGWYEFPWILGHVNLAIFPHLLSRCTRCD